MLVSFQEVSYFWTNRPTYFTKNFFKSVHLQAFLHDFNFLFQAIGLSVEFISHVVHTFSQKTQLSRKERVIDAMGTMGPAVSRQLTGLSIN